MTSLHLNLRHLSEPWSPHFSDGLLTLTNRIFMKVQWRMNIKLARACSRLSTAVESYCPFIPGLGHAVNRARSSISEWMQVHVLSTPAPH